MAKQKKITRTATRKANKARRSTKSPVTDNDSDITPVQENLTDTESITKPKSNSDYESDYVSGTEKLASDLDDATNEFEKATIIGNENNPHSAQANLAKTLNQPTHVTRLQQLAEAANERAALRKERALRKRAKKRKELALATRTTKTKTKSSKDISDDSSVSESEASISSDDSDYGKKPKARNKKKGNKSKQLNQNTYAILSSEQTPKTKNRAGISKANKKRQKKLTRIHRTFFSAKIKVQASNNSMQELLKKTQAWFRHLRQTDETAIIYPFKDTDPTSALASPDEIPDSLAPYRNFFNNATPREAEGHVWINMHIGHTESNDEILREMGNYKNSTDTFTYVKKLQTRYVAKEYFLLWSTDYIDTNALVKAVQNKIAESTSKKYLFAFAWSPIKGENGKKYRCEKKDRYRNTDLGALHIQVPQDTKDETYDVLSKCFGLDTTEHILGREMLMVPIIKKTNTIHKNNNIEHLIEKHAQFYSKLDYAKNLDFSQIDHRDKRLKMTIREMIMEINSLDGKNTKLFWSIDENKEGIFITFPSFVGEQARNTIAQLPSLLCFIHGIEVLSLMTPAAQRRALAAPWDPTQMRAISKEDKRLEAMILATSTPDDDDDDISDMDTDDDSINTTEELDGDIAREVDEYLFERASSNHSVTTLDTRMGSSNIQIDDEIHEVAPSPTKKQKADHTDDDSTDDMNTTSDLYNHNDKHGLSFDNSQEMDLEGAELDSIPLQQQPRPPELPEGPGVEL